MRGKLPRDYTTQGSAFKAKKRDGDQTDIKGLRATVPAEEFVPEQQRAVAAAFPARLRPCPRPAPAASAHNLGRAELPTEPVPSRTLPPSGAGWHPVPPQGKPRPEAAFIAEPLFPRMTSPARGRSGPDAIRGVIYM